MRRLRGELAVVTGAASGWGRAIVSAYAEAGMRVAIIDVAADQLSSAAAGLRDLGAPEVLDIAADLGDAEQTQRAADEVMRSMGATRVLVHCAALMREASMRESDLAGFEQELDVAIQAAYVLSKAAWEPMIAAGGGSIVYVSSRSGVEGFAREAAYCPAKHAIEGLMKVQAIEGHEFGIAANTIIPGIPIRTPMSERLYTAALRDVWVDPDLLSPALLFLARAAPADVTGKQLDAWQLSQAVRASVAAP